VRRTYTIRVRYDHEAKEKKVLVEADTVDEAFKKAVASVKDEQAEEDEGFSPRFYCTLVEVEFEEDWV
jgi:hypothetical protein